MSFVGGKLSLKGGEPLKAAGAGVKKKKKKSSKADKGDAPDGGEGGEGTTAAAAGGSKLAGRALTPPPEDADRRTEAEKRRAEKMARVEEERLRKIATKGYRDRVKDFNEHLASLSEHHDIPKVGPG